MFDEYFNPPTIAVSPVQEATALKDEVLGDSPVSIFINQDAPSTSIPSSQEQEHSPIISQGFEESPKTPMFHDDPLNESPQDSASQGSSSNVIQIHIPFEHLELNNFRQAMIDPSWIDAMQEEIYEFERLKVLELVPCPDNMTNKFKISMMGANVILLGLQISQILRGTFINQSKYASEIVKKYGLNSTDSVDTPTIENKKLDGDLQGKQVDLTLAMLSAYVLGVEELKRKVKIKGEKKEALLTLKRLPRKNEFKARGTLLMALPNKHHLKFNIQMDAKTLMEVIEKQFCGNKETKKVQKTLLKQQYENFTGSSFESLDQIHDRLQKLISQLEILRESFSQEDINLNLKIYEAEVKSSSSTSTSTQNIAFVSSQTTDNTNEPVSVVASVSTASAKIPVFALPNRIRRNLRTNGPTLMGFDMSKVECYNYHMKRHFARECRSPKGTRRNIVAEPQKRNVPVKTSTSNALVSQYDGVGSYDWSFQAEEEPTNYALMSFTSLSSSNSDNEEHLCHLHTSFNVELSPTKPDKDLSPRPSAPIIEDWVSDLKDDSEAEHPQNAPSFVQPTEQVKSPRPSVNPVETSIPAASYKTKIPKPKTHGNSKNRKACFVCKSLTHLIKHCNYYEKKMAQTPARNHAQRGNHQHYARITLPNVQKHVVPTAALTKSKLVLIIAARPVIADVPKPHGNWVCKPKCPILDHVSRNTSASITLKRNMSYLFDFEELNGGYVAFGGNPKGGKIFGKGKIRTGKLDFDDVYFVKELKFNLFSVLQMCDKKNNVLFTNTECIVLSLEFKLPDENQVLLKFPRDNNMYNVDLKNIVPSGDLTYDYSRFTWVFFLATKDETNLILKIFITGIKNQLSLKVKIIKSDNGTEFKNHDLNRFFGVKGIKREFSVPRTPQQNGIAERKNKTLIEAARTMLLDSLLPVPCWAQAVNTACYVQNRVLVTKPQNKTPYELLLCRTPNIGFMRPFVYLVTILNTLDPLGNQSNPSRGVQEQFDAGKAGEENVQQYVLFPLWSFGSKNPQNTNDDVAFRGKKLEFERKKPKSENTNDDVAFGGKKLEFERKKPKSEVHVSSSSTFEDFFDNSINEVNVADNLVPAVGQISTNSTNTFSAVGPSNTVVSQTHAKSSYMDPSQYPDDLNMPALEDITYFDDEEDVGAEVDFTNLETNITGSPIPTTRVHKDHPVTQIIGDLSSATQTRSMTRVVKDQGGLTQINNEDFHTCMFACFLSQEEPKRVHQALKDPS
nr:putative ribonuclease H-like domain-containing protein [Tanacetum cinerariifolium]